MSFGAQKSGSTNLEALLQQGISAARDGRKEAARLMFRRVLDSDQQNERAWLWLATVAEDTVERKKALETVLHINPNNQRAQEYLAQMESRRAVGESQSLRIGIIVVVILVIVVLVAIVAAFILSQPHA